METENIQRIIGRYIVGKTIGEGSFGKVRLSTNIETGEKVAIKEIDKSKVLLEKGAKEKLEREIKILQMIDHPNVVRLFEVFEDEQFLYLVMEYAETGELFDFIVTHGRISEDLARDFFRQIIAGVDYCHKLNIVHRDIKPENLLLNAEMKVIIIDFGLANFTHLGELLTTSCGSLSYSAPELILGKEYIGPKVDIWSLGVVLYAILCGFLPFQGPTVRDLCQRIVQGSFQVPSFISLEATDLLYKIIDKNPDSRYTIEQIKVHPWFTKGTKKQDNLDNEQDFFANISIDDEVLMEMKQLNFDSEEIRELIKNKIHNSTTEAYRVFFHNKQKRMDAQMKQSAQTRQWNRNVNFPVQRPNFFGIPNQQQFPSFKPPQYQFPFQNTFQYPSQKMYYQGMNPSQMPFPQQGARAQEHSVQSQEMEFETEDQNEKKEIPQNNDNKRYFLNPSIFGPPLGYFTKPSVFQDPPFQFFNAQNTQQGINTNRININNPNIQSNGNIFPQQNIKPQFPIPNYAQRKFHSNIFPQQIQPQSHFHPYQNPQFPPYTLPPFSQPNTSMETIYSQSPVSKQRANTMSTNEMIEISSKIQTQKQENSMDHEPSPQNEQQNPNIFPQKNPKITDETKRDRAITFEPHDIPKISIELNELKKNDNQQTREARGAFDASTTSSRSPKSILKRCKRMLKRQNVIFKEKGFVLKCTKNEIKFELEIVRVQNLRKLNMIKFKRIIGDIWEFQKLCALLVQDLKL
eukprot:Anaeramoba_ignava/a482136_49.p1 GENE.a482136_49~~a482136_49.p1  ORF type:complete len:744 (-),score=162.98 a482136_49:431-2662(-)